MGKRSTFERKPRDFYPTPEAAVLPLLPFLSPKTFFYEPCLGQGHLVEHLEKYGHVCPEGADMYYDGYEAYGTGFDARTHQYDRPDAECFITNPPWDRAILHPIIENLRKQKPTWLLIDADWAHTKQAAPHLRYCTEIIAIGRVKWIPGSKYTGKDNCCWYRFDTAATRPVFIGRGCEINPDANT